MRVPENVNLTSDQQRVLEMAIEFYIRLGLGQFSEIATRLDLLCGKRLDPEQLHRVRELCKEMEGIVCGDKAWSLTDEATSLYTLTAFLLEAQMHGKMKSARWARDRIKNIDEKIL